MFKEVWLFDAVIIYNQCSAVSKKNEYSTHKDQHKIEKIATKKTQTTSE